MPRRKRSKARGQTWERYGDPTIQVAVRIPVPLHDRVVAHAHLNKTPKSRALVALLQAGLEKSEKGIFE